MIGAGVDAGDDSVVVVERAVTSQCRCVSCRSVTLAGARRTEGLKYEEGRVSLLYAASGVWNWHFCCFFYPRDAL